MNFKLGSPEYKNVIIVDFDGTICEEIKVEEGPSKPGLPKLYVKEALEELKKLGYIIKIHSCRTATYWNNKNREQQIQVIRKYMGKYNLLYDEIIISPNLDKPLARFYIDNRSIRYENNWTDIIKQIEKVQKEK